jgi:processive 1,2-diacylglycerol beta-glucosyltransferase
MVEMDSMKPLILTCNTGEGHNSVSAAVREAFAQRDLSCGVADALSFLSERASEFICSWHVRIYRYIPKAFRSGYRYVEEHPATYEENTLLHKFLVSGADKLWEYVSANGYDCFICPHVFAALMVTQMLKEHPIPGARSCFIATDYTCSPMVGECRVDFFFVPDASTVPEFLAAGLPAERIVPVSGIPVRQAFCSRTPKAEARAQLGLPAQGAHLLMMCGSMGCGPMAELTDLLAASLPAGAVLSVVCGTNERLEKKLLREYQDRPEIRVLGYTDRVSLLMDSADLYLTKPGGISTAEAAAKGLPLVLVDAVAGCEEYNLRYFCAQGGAVTAGTPEELAALTTSLLADPARLAQMAARIRKPGNAAGEICSRMTGLS